MTPLQQAVIRTISYFDLFDVPLTREQLHRWLFELEAEKGALDVAVTELLCAGKLQCVMSYLVLPEREGIVTTHAQRVPIVERKMRIAKRAAKKLRWIPFVRAVYACNMMGYVSVDEASDVDVFIVARRGRIWLVRLLAVALLLLWRLRISKRTRKDRICLTFYVTDAHSNLHDIRIGDDDVYFLYWLAQLIPVYDPERFITQLWNDNPWLAQALPQCGTPFHTSERWLAKEHGLVRGFRGFWEGVWQGWYGDMLETRAKTVQQMKIRQHFEDVAKTADTAVVITDEVLKFHTNDRRAAIRGQWRSRCQKGGAPLPV